MDILGTRPERYSFLVKGLINKPTLEYNELTFCKTRMKWMNRVNRKNPAINLGRPTFRWVHLCLNAIKRLPKVIPKIEIPILNFTSRKRKNSR